MIATPVFSNVWNKYSFGLSTVIDSYRLLWIIINCYRFWQSIKIDNFFLWVRLWSISIDNNRRLISIDINWYRVYRLISDIDFYRLTTPGLQVLEQNCLQKPPGSDKYIIDDITNGCFPVIWPVRHGNPHSLVLMTAWLSGNVPRELEAP